MQEELEKRQKRNGPGDSSILAVDSIAAYSSIEALTRRLEGNGKKNEKEKRLQT
ncbi:hypothetical protein PVK06_048356 [Gossypium arboreum]|uniref:Uncharacterized protein n=1 Tax=Gossypium arboreum TaxID=29729 RepID=A0ABR0MG94_GOSAR|nr:hypothetical protein PVK06_048356 [Gossypium arboreum]